MAGLTKRKSRNRNVRCVGQSVLRDSQNIAILDADGARQYYPCKNWAANGTDRCGQHGGALVPTIAAARRRLLYGAGELVEILERIAKDETSEHRDRIRAINSYLDRAGIRTGVEVSVETPKWQRLLGDLFGIPEDDSLAPKADMEETPKRRAKASRPREPVPDRPKFEGWV